MIRVIINGQKLVFNTNRQIIRFLMESIVDDPYASLEARKENLSKMLKMFGFKRKEQWVNRIESEERFSKAFWNILLAMEEMDTLPGFSVWAPIEKGRTNYNPEKVRITDDGGRE